jgi:hypothetical protein
MKAAKELNHLSQQNWFSDDANDCSQFEVNDVNAKKGPASAESAMERHFTVNEIAEMWQLDEKMIRRIFGDEPGVVSIGSGESRFRRAYRTLRIPESVLVRVHRRLRRAG